MTRLHTNPSDCHSITTNPAAERFLLHVTILLVTMAAAVVTLVG
jgi:hypothetical protein